jgi:hypothetical protein
MAILDFSSRPIVVHCDCRGATVDIGRQWYSNFLIPRLLGSQAFRGLPWRPPETWADLDNRTLNAILDKIDAGSPDGERYSATPSAKDRHAWRVVKSVARKIRA